MTPEVYVNVNRQVYKMYVLVKVTRYVIVKLYIKSRQDYQKLCSCIIVFFFIHLRTLGTPMTQNELVALRLFIFFLFVFVCFTFFFHIIVYRV